MRGIGVRRGNATTSRTRGMTGNGTERGMTRGNGVMRGGGAHRWEAARLREAMQQPARQEGGNATTSQTRSPIEA
jgi:hypothetical protein